MGARKLVAGENAGIDRGSVSLAVTARDPSFAMGRCVIGQGFSPSAWSEGQPNPPGFVSPSESGLTVDLARAENVDRILVAVFSVDGSGFLTGSRGIDGVFNDFSVSLSGGELAVAAVLVAEFYRRNGSWKIRARNDGTAGGISELARRHGVELAGPSPAQAEPAGRRKDPDWSGSGCLVGPNHVLTNAHVVKGATRIFVSSFDGESAARPVVVDEANDLALVHVECPAGSFPPPAFRVNGVSLGEEAFTLGYPLHGVLGSSPHFTAGSVSALLGPDDDARILQITCPIQPGSSGCPVFDAGGNVIGVATASLNRGQNVNFAVRSALAVSLLEAAGIEVLISRESVARDRSLLIRQNSNLVRRLECFR